MSVSVPEAEAACRRKANIAQHGQMRKQIERLKHKTDLASEPIHVDLCMRLLTSAGVTPQRILGGSSIFGTAALIEAGIGVSCLPEPLFASYVAQKRLQRIATSPAPPTLR